MRTLILAISFVLLSGFVHAQDSTRVRLDLLNNRIVQMFYAGDQTIDSLFELNIAEAKSLAKSINDKKALSNLLRMEGLRAAGVFGNVEKGYSKVDSAFSLSFQSSDSIGISRGHAAKANLFLYQNDPEKALTHFIASLEYADQSDDLELLQSYYALAYCYDRLDEESEAQYFFNKVLSLNISSPGYLPKSAYYKMMADAYHYLDRFGDAEFFLTKFLSTPESQLSTYDLMHAHFMKGAIENAKEADDVAKSHYLKSLEYGDKIGDTILFPETQFNLGLTYSLMGIHDSAMESMELAVKLFERAGRKHDLFDSYTAMGDIFYNSASYGRANEKYRLASSISYDIADTNRILKGLANMQDVQYSLKAYRSSSSYSRKILEFTLEDIDNIGVYVVRAQMNLGDCQFEEGKFNAAYEYYEKAIKEADNFNLEARKALAFYNMAWVRMEQKKKVDAGILINKGFKIADKMGLSGTKKQLCEASNYLKYQMKYEGSLPAICETY